MAIDQSVTTNFGVIPTSASLGVAMVDRETSLYFDKLIPLADNALYQAKEDGRKSRGIRKCEFI